MKIWARTKLRCILPPVLMVSLPFPHKISLTWYVDHIVRSLYCLATTKIFEIQWWLLNKYCILLSLSKCICVNKDKFLHASIFLANTMHPHKKLFSSCESCWFDSRPASNCLQIIILIIPIIFSKCNLKNTTYYL